ncbi:MAG TPA: hypothetical protein DHW76_08935 [Clostridiaceae bacterium]|jgi:hypothetical protein|nr:hypothetical protein [Clostridiaceae bacterium]
MNKKWLLFTAVAIIIAAVTVGTVFAIAPIKLIINGQEVSPSVPMQIVGNEVMAPVTQIAEKLGATVEWDNKNKTVKISNKEQQDIEKRLKLLEFALTPQSPKEAADTLAKGVMSRNGALQYAVLCDNLKSKYKADFEAFDWWTGASSPWIDSYQISDGEKQLDGTWKFTIKFHYTDSTKASYFSTSNILVGPKKESNPQLPIYPNAEQKWCVIGIEH